MRKLFKFSFKYIKSHFWPMIFYIILCIFVSLFSLAIPLITGNFIDLLVSSKNIDFLLKYCLLFIGISISSMVVGYVSNRLYIRLQTKIAYDLNRDVISHVQQLSISFMKGHDSGYLNQRINNDSNAVITFCLSIIQNVTVNIVTLLASFAFLFHFNALIALLIVILIAVYYITYVLFKQPLFKEGYNYKEVQSKYFGKMQEQISNIPFVKIHSIFRIFLSRLDVAFEHLLSTALKYQRLTYIFSSIDSLIATFAQVVLFVFGGIAVINGELSLGFFTVLSSYFGMLLSAARYFFNLGKSIQENLVSYNRLQDILNIKLETNGCKVLQSIDRINIKNLCFSFGEKRILSKINTEFISGNIYLIKGANGSGKTTLINLLVGLYIDEYHGEIIYNNDSIRLLDMTNIRRELVGITEQEPVLLGDTIRFNLLFDTNTIIDMNRMGKLIHVLGLESYINSLSNGIDSLISEKADNLSGGEKQKVSLLRALLKNPDLIILDEPTSALDSASCSRLKLYLESIKSSKIIIIITHDKSFATIADECIPLEEL